MRGLLTTSIGVTCAAALTLPLTTPALATPAPPAPPVKAVAAAGQDAARTPHSAVPDTPGPPYAAALPDTPGTPNTPALPGSTQSLPLSPLPRERPFGALAQDQGLPRQDVNRFSLLGVVWDDPDTELHGSVQVRTRAADTHAWSGWQDVETHNADHGADPDTPERTSGRVRGATAPLWVGDSDGVEVRVQADGTLRSRTEETARGGRTVWTQTPLPSGLRVDLVDPGSGTPEHTLLGSTLLGTTQEVPELDEAGTEREFLALRGAGLTGAQRAKPYIGPRPGIVTRRGWGADESLRGKKFLYTKKIKAAFVHHTATGNKYTCSQVPSAIRSIYRYHVKSMGWRDIGYNFLVDKCGNIYEGRAGGVAKPVLGAHTRGFNSDTMGIAVIGTFRTAKPSSAAVKAIARLTAWKLGLYSVNPKGKTYLKSGGGNLYRKGTNVRLNVISGHRDGFATDCPGGKLYGKLGSARSKAAQYQGR